MANININTKFLAWFAIIFLLVSLYFNASLFSKNKELQQYKDTSLEKLKAEKDSIIQVNLLQIDSLLKASSIKDLTITSANKRIDSLENVKGKVRVIYKEKIKEIEGFSGKQLENYWKDEFK
jgi:hypothetical protein